MLSARRHDPICPMNSSASVKQTEASLQRKCGKTKKMTENYGGVGAGERWDPFQVRDSVRPKGPGSLIAANDRLKGPSCCCISAHCALAARRMDKACVCGCAVVAVVGSVTDNFVFGGFKCTSSSYRVASQKNRKVSPLFPASCRLLASRWSFAVAHTRFVLVLE